MLEIHVGSDSEMKLCWESIIEPLETGYGGTEEFGKAIKPSNSLVLRLVGVDGVEISRTKTSLMHLTPDLAQEVEVSLQPQGKIHLRLCLSKIYINE